MVLIINSGIAESGITPLQELPFAVMLLELPCEPTFLENAALMTFAAKAVVTVEARKCPDAINRDRVAFQAEMLYRCLPEQSVSHTSH